MKQTQPLNELLPNLPISFRPIHEEDRELLCRIYAGTREEELAVVPGDPDEKRAFLELQFKAQHQYYQQQHPAAAFELILLDGVPIGRLYLDMRRDELRIIDIALLPAYRGRGIGTSILTAVLGHADAQGLPVRVHVEQNTPALRLYKRLSFRPLKQEGIYYLLEWTPSTRMEAGTAPRRHEPGSRPA